MRKSINIELGDEVRVTATNEQCQKLYIDAEKYGNGTVGYVVRVFEKTGRVALDNGEIYEHWMLQALR
mgnify:CR=1 FL=1